MTVAELIAKLEKWPQDAEIVTYEPRHNWLADVREIREVNYWAAYNLAFVVID